MKRLLSFVLSVLFVISCASKNQDASSLDVLESDVSRSVSKVKTKSKTEASSNVYSLVSGRSHSCVLTQKSEVKCWGSSKFKENGADEVLNVPTDINLDEKFTVRGIAAGSYHNCLLTDGDDIKCWGEGSWGQIGSADFKTSSSLVTVKMEPKQPVKALALGSNFSCALLKNGKVKCWGANDQGQLGDGSLKKKSTPVDVALAPKDQAISLRAGYHHACVLLADGKVKCWGANDRGQILGVKDKIQKTPVTIKLKDSSPVQALVLNTDVTCTLTGKGTANCWGQSSILFGDKTPVKTPQNVNPSSMPKVKTLAIGSSSMCFLSTTGVVQCKGLNDKGQLGNKSKVDNGSLTKIAQTDRIKILTVGDGFGCVLTKRGRVKCFGDGTNGKLGIPGETSVSVPTDLGL